LIRIIRLASYRILVEATANLIAIVLSFISTALSIAVFWCRAVILHSAQQIGPSVPRSDPKSGSTIFRWSP